MSAYTDALALFKSRLSAAEYLHSANVAKEAFLRSRILGSKGVLSRRTRELFMCAGVVLSLDNPLNLDFESVKYQQIQHWTNKLNLIAGEAVPAPDPGGGGGPIPAGGTFMGHWNASTTLFPPGTTQFQFWIVNIAGMIDGQFCPVGSWIVVQSDSPAQTWDGLNFKLT